MPSTDSLPSRLRESSFRKYEDDIARIVAEYPDVVLITTENNQLTYVARLRDAILSYHLYNWDTEKIDRASFILAYEGLIVSHKKDVILAGERSQVLSYQKNVGNISAMIQRPDKQEVITMDDLDSNQVTFLCVLASKRLLTNPIRTGCLNQEGKHHLEDQFDVMIEDNQDGTFTII